MVFVKYFIPEDGDMQSNPNVFKVEKCKSVSTLTLGHIKASFPIDGKYHFRFLVSLPSNAGKVWMDAINPDDIVPHSSNSEVFAKVSRIGVQHYNIAHQLPPQQQQQSSNNTRSPTATSSTRRDSFGAPTGSGSGERDSIDSGRGGGSNSRRGSERLISFSDDTPSKSPFHATGTNINSGGGDEGLLDFGSSDDADFEAASASSSNNGGSNIDLFALDSSTISQTPVSTTPLPSPMSSMGGINNKHAPMGGINPMGGMMHSNNIQMGVGNNNSNGVNGMGMGMGAMNINNLPHPNQLQANSMQRGGPKNDSFSGLDSLTGLGMGMHNLPQSRR
jgi:hypothetical protein